MPSPLELHRAGVFGGVALAWCSGGQTEHEFTDSVLRTVFYDRDVGQGVIWGIISAISSPRIAEIRCQLVEEFLTDTTMWRDHTPPDWLLMVDTDMVWEPDALYQLLAAADPMERPIVGGFCLAGNPDINYPTIYRLIRDEHGAIGVERDDQFPVGEVIRVGGTGAAFLLAHRRVLTAMGNKFRVLPDGRPNPYPWFFEGIGASGKPFGEDVGFCINAQALGAPIHVHTGCMVNHVKATQLDPRQWWKEHR